MQIDKPLALMREEWVLGAAIATGLAFLFFGDTLLSGLSNPFWLTFIFAWLFSVVLVSVLAVVRHADHLAARLGEPYGTLILTLSVTAIEAMSISAVMLHGANNPTLVRDTLFAVIMLILNGMVGMSLLFGGWRYREQQYNLQGANAYLGVIVPLAVLSVVMPNFTQSTPGPTLSVTQEIFLTLVSVGLYAAFLAIQTGRHRQYFVMGNAESAGHVVELVEGGVLRHALLLFTYMVPVVFLAEQLAPPIDYEIETMHAPAALGGLAIATLVATPEAIGAVKAAAANQIQRSMNIFLGSVLATIGLTIPVMLVVGQLTGRTMVLGVQGSDEVLLLLTLFLAGVTFSSGRTNILQGLVHVLLFLFFLLLIFER
jgi:Ca2+:H+ antiporter